MKGCGSSGQYKTFQTLRARYEARGVRLDLYVEDEAGTIYNVEVQATQKKNVPKRIRYYQSIIDLHILSPGADYEKLRKSYVIFICNHDPFGKNRYVYRFENRCIDDPALALGDETVKVIVNTKGTEGSISPEMKELLKYLDDGTVGGDYTRELAAAVNGIKSSEGRRREYMVWALHEYELREEGREEGQNLLGTLMTKLKNLGREDDAFAAAADPAYRERLYQEFHMA